MKTQKIYDKTIVKDGNYLRIEVEPSFLHIHFNSKHLFSANYSEYVPCTQYFTVETNGKLTTYDITFLLNAYAKCLVGKNGWLIYSDDPAIEVCEVETVTDNLRLKE